MINRIKNYYSDKKNIIISLLVITNFITLISLGKIYYELKEYTTEYDIQGSYQANGAGYNFSFYGGKYYVFNYIDEIDRGIYEKLSDGFYYLDNGKEDNIVLLTHDGFYFYNQDNNQMDKALLKSRNQYLIYKDYVLGIHNTPEGFLKEVNDPNITPLGETSTIKAKMDILSIENIAVNSGSEEIVIDNMNTIDSFSEIIKTIPIKWIKRSAPDIEPNLFISINDQYILKLSDEIYEQTDTFYHSLENTVTNEEYDFRTDFDLKTLMEKELNI
ncbi:MAG: hypothetical protein GXZ08_00415 [Tissierellia bacterium]|nr:hypothetical protein [Tissierellia bacterium]